MQICLNALMIRLDIVSYFFRLISCFFLFFFFFQLNNKVESFFSLQLLCNGPGTCIPICLAVFVLKVSFSLLGLEPRCMLKYLTV